MVTLWAAFMLLSNVAWAQPKPADMAGAGHSTPRSHAPVSGGIERDIRILTQRLGLDAPQQAQLREVLEEQRRQMRKLWVDNPRPDADRTGATLAILDRTREQIRAMLTEEQKKKYPAPVPRNLTGPAQVDRDYWLRQIQPDAQTPAKAANQGVERF